MRAAGGRGQVLILLATWLFFGGGAASALVASPRPRWEARVAKSVISTVPGAPPGSMAEAATRSSPSRTVKNRVPASWASLMCAGS